MTDAVLVMKPSEATEAVAGWPDGCWLVAAPSDGRLRVSSVQDQEAPERLPVLVAGRPVFPELEGFPRADLRFDQEAALIAAVERHAQRVAAMAEQALGRRPPLPAARVRGAVRVVTFRCAWREAAAWTLAGALCGGAAATVAVLALAA